MKRFYLVVLLCSSLLSGCGFLGIYRHRKAEWAPPEEREKVSFPNSLEKGRHMTGPMIAALKVAMDTFMPPGVRFKGGDAKLNQCLSRWETFDVSVLQASDDLFFVRFLPDISRCGIDAIVLDAGALYAVDSRGRILAME